jgi:hypothetical protein
MLDHRCQISDTYCMTIQAIISEFGASAKAKLSDKAIMGAP